MGSRWVWGLGITISGSATGETSLVDQSLDVQGACRELERSCSAMQCHALGTSGMQESESVRMHLTQVTRPGAHPGDPSPAGDLHVGHKPRCSTEPMHQLCPMLPPSTLYPSHLPRPTATSPCTNRYQHAQSPTPTVVSVPARSLGNPCSAAAAALMLRQSSVLELLLSCSLQAHYFDRKI